jgi:hypothetical protein
MQTILRKLAKASAEQKRVKPPLITNGRLDPVGQDGCVTQQVGDHDFTWWRLLLQRG